MPYADPTRQRAAKAEHARRSRAAGVEPRRGTVAPLLSHDMRLSTAADVLAVVADQVAAVLADENVATVERARTVATLSGVALRAIEAADLVARVEAVELALAASVARREPKR